LLSACAEAPEGTPGGGGLPLSGKLEAIVVEGGPGVQGGTRYFLRTEDGARVVELDFDEPPESATGTLVTVYGEDAGDTFHVRAWDVDAEAEPGPRSLRQALLGEPVERASTVAFVRVDFGQGINVDVDEADDFMFSTTNPGPAHGLDSGDKSVAQYYDEVSFGQMQVSGAVEGPLSWSNTACNGNGGSQLAQSLRNQIDEDYDHYIWYYGSVQPSCGYGWGSLGSWSSPSSNVWFNGDLFDVAITHEIGHNLGYQHASSMRCNGTALADNPMTCETEEYGSTVSVMGNLSAGHMMGIEKWYAGWFEGCNGVRVRSTGTFTLHAIETECDGIQTLQIPMPTTSRSFSTEQSGGSNPMRFYYLELRSSVGLDTGMTNQVMVHASDDVRSPNQTSARSVLIDMNPSSNPVNGMTAGQSFTDPAGGVTFRVDSVDGAKATVTVTLEDSDDPSTCMDGSELVGSGPDTCTDTGGGSGGSGGTGGGGTGGTGGSGGAATGGGGAGGSAVGGATAGGAGGSGGTGGTTSGGAGGTDSSATGVGGTGGSGGTTAGGASFGGSATSGSAGVGGSGIAGFGGASAGASSIGGGAAVPIAPSDDGGCSCRTAGRGTSQFPSGLVVAAGLAAGLGLRRRKSARIAKAG
jgi:MYXO-CTERM domain-containing protein